MFVALTTQQTGQLKKDRRGEDRSHGLLFARGQLLILAPWEHHNEALTIKRDQCLQLNDLARLICEQE